MTQEKIYWENLGIFKRRRRSTHKILEEYEVEEKKAKDDLDNFRQTN